MKKWLKRYGGFFAGVLLALIGTIFLNIVIDYSEIIGRFILTILGIISVGMGVTFIGLQHNKNKKEFVVKKQDVKFEDNTKSFEKIEEINNVVRYTKKYIYTETKEDEKHL